MKYSVKVLLALLISVCMVSWSFAAGDLQNRTRDIGLFGGVLLPSSGTVSIDTDAWSIDCDTAMGFVIKGYFDQFLAPMFGVGVYGQYTSTAISPENTDLEVDADMYEFGITFKPKFVISPTAAIKPGLEIGYRKFSRESFAPGDTDTDGDGLALNMSAEIQFMLDKGYTLGLIFGFIAQPTGGTKDSDVAWAPIWYVSAGIVF
ncbi:MAG: hypothetical protein N3F66_11910 [Spirochaetes bacterium]|nr:hypothetical protein [Spirochaetota bacterium]